MMFGIVCNTDDKVTVEFTKKVLDTLKSRGHKIELEKGLPEVLKTRAEGVPIGKMISKMVLAIGGDGTILRAFRELGSSKIPVLGVNCGTIGFLAETDAKNFEIALKRVEKGKYFIDERSRLSIQVDGTALPFALNELTISAVRGSTIVRYALKVNGEEIYRDSADGIIVSTPTGSTGYALSAGGPVVSGKSNVFVVIPICSINQNKPYIVNDDSKITITDISSSAGCEAVIDGRFRVELSKKIVAIRKANAPACFVRLQEGSHSRVFSKLRKKYEADAVPNDAPPSAKFIFKILQYEGSLTQQEIVKSSMLPSRTVRSALQYLIKNGLITKQTSIRDIRQSIYFVG
jgi:NAD+ kinase